MSRRPTKRGAGIIAALLAISMLAAACGGGDDSSNGDGDSGSGTPVYGGEVIYGLEAETSGGWCLPEAQLAISGIQVARSIYDTLTAPNAEGEYVPFLAESVEPNDDYTAVDDQAARRHQVPRRHRPRPPTVVKNNLDAYRGAVPGASAAAVHVRASTTSTQSTWSTT